MGGGGSQNTTTTQKFEPPSWTASLYPQVMQSAVALANRPYEQSGIPQVAPWNDFQQAASQAMYDRFAYGAPDINAGRGAAMLAAQGNYANPWAQNVAGIASGHAYNPYAASVYNLSQNAASPYATDEYTNQIIGINADNMIKGYQEGSAAQQDAAAAMAGAFGGSGWQQMQDKGAQGLAKNIGDMATQVQQQQQQFMHNAYNQAWGNSLQALMSGSGMYNQDVANQMNANAQGGAMYAQDIGNILAGAGLTGQLSEEDYKAMSGMMNAGNNYSTYNQKLLDSLNNQWSLQQQYDYAQLTNLLNAMGQASGGYGQSTQTAPYNQGNNLMNALGLGLTGYAAYKL